MHEPMETKPVGVQPPCTLHPEGQDRRLAGSTYAYENFMEMYEAYHELGGNGMITKMYEEIQELHLKKKEGNVYEEY